MQVLPKHVESSGRRDFVHGNSGDVTLALLQGLRMSQILRRLLRILLVVRSGVPP